jgi:hypothetical protein
VSPSLRGGETHERSFIVFGKPFKDPKHDKDPSQNVMDAIWGGRSARSSDVSGVVELSNFSLFNPLGSNFSSSGLTSQTRRSVKVLGIVGMSERLLFDK